MLNIIKSFFFSKDKFCPPYFWVTVLMVIVVTMLTMRVLSIHSFSDVLILGMCGMVVTWCGLYNLQMIKGSNDKQDKSDVGDS